MQVAIRIRPENLEPTLLATQLLIIIVISTLWGIIPDRPHSRFQFQCYYAHFQSIYLVHLIGHHFFFSNLKNFFPYYAPKQLKKGAMVELKVLKAYKGFCGLCIDCNQSPLSYLVTKKVSYKIQCVHFWLTRSIEKFWQELCPNLTLYKIGRCYKHYSHYFHHCNPTTVLTAVTFFPSTRPQGSQLKQLNIITSVSSRVCYHSHVLICNNKQMIMSPLMHFQETAK